MKEGWICNNEDGNYGELPNHPSSDLGAVSSPEECTLKCESGNEKGTIINEEGCCSRKNDGHCWWYPKSSTTCCWAKTDYSAAKCKIRGNTIYILLCTRFTALKYFLVHFCCVSFM